MLKSVFKKSFIVLLIVISGKVFSFLRDIMISWKFGSGLETDAYFAANNVPSILFAAIVSSYLVLFIPLYNKVLINEGQEKVDVFVSNLLSIFFIGSILLSTVGYFSMDFLIDFVAPGFNQETRLLAVKFGRVLVLSFAFSSSSLILSNVSNARNVYYAPHIIPLISSIIVIVGIFFFGDNYGPLAMAVSGVLAFVIILGIQWYLAKGFFNFNFIINLRDTNLKKMTWLVAPIFIGFSIDQLNLLVNTAVASGLGEGSLSALTFSQRLQGTISGTISTSIITVLYPIISKLYVEKKDRDLIYLTKVSLKLIFILLFPTTIYLAVYSSEFVKIIYYRGEFDLLDVKNTATVFSAYSINVLFLALREIILRLYYIKEKTKIPLYTSVISLGLNAGLSIFLSNHIGLLGLSVANLIATFINLLIMYLLINRKLNFSLRVKDSLLYLVNITMPCIIFLGLIVVDNSLFMVKEGVSMFVLKLIVYNLLFVLTLVLFKNKETLMLFKLLRNKINGNKK
ncbi:murein biosynthesis integral membrane protein MurJ [Lishizhenia sp.]|uniref:murein biosynthesis integral membrane protein MurJ n=1 Tax=Lishizhenia sp. TaxID=2497594 RepID=UPI00299E8CBF|nr:murein biosynthesis integral membrane protein MurJ [Lishizhenia sp.]MDX1446647.1 murein biosynthesis integral membrane protein MurJ [Lishizhenia sp.]